MQALILRVLVVDDSEIIPVSSAESFNRKQILTSSAKLRTER